MDLWTSVPETGKRRLNLIGETRWWANGAALTKVFEPTDEKERSPFVTIIIVLEKIERDPRSRSDARHDAYCYRHNLSKYNTVLTAFMLRNIITPLSTYKTEE